MERGNRKNSHVFFLSMSLLFVAIFFISFALGRYPIPPQTVLKVLLSKIFPIAETWSKSVETVIFQIRIPRIIAAIFIGSALSLSGLTFQGLFQNPMVSPDVLGTSNGAAFGAAIGILLNMHYAGIVTTSFLTGIGAVILVLAIASRVPSMPVLGMVLSGIMVSSFFTSLVSFIKLIADTQNTLPAITYFLMGSLSSIRSSDTVFLVIIITLSTIPIILIRWHLNVMTQGEEEAKSLGVNTRVIRLIAISSATLMTSVTVAVAGMIGWVGLVIPHLTRMCLGCDYRKTIPGSIIMGSTFLLLVDTIARSISTIEIPLGILTSFVGAPFFLYLIIREGKKL